MNEIKYDLGPVLHSLRPGSEWVIYGAKYSGILGFAQDHGNGIIQEFPK